MPPNVVTPARHAIVGAFRKFDSDGDGSLTRQELRQALGALLEREVEESGDAEREGGVSLEDFETRVYEMFRDLREADSSPKQQRGSIVDGNWGGQLAKLLTAFKAEEGAPPPPSQPSSKARGVLSKVKHALPSAEAHGKRAAERQNLSKQHDAMVAHFNLRRMSVDLDEAQGAAMAKLAAAKGGWRMEDYMLGRQGWLGPWSPNSLPRRIWEVIILLLVLFQAVYIPFTVAFMVEISTNSSWGYFDWVADFIFVVDLIATFNVGFIDEKKVVHYSRRAIFFRYVKSWFFVDFVASVPFDRVLTWAQSRQSGGRAAALLKGFKLPRLLRLLKVMRVARLLKLASISHEVIWWLQYSRHSNMIRLSFVLILCLSSINYFACLFFPIMRSIYLDRMDCSALTHEEYDAYLDSEGTVGNGVVRSCMDEKTDLQTKYYSSFYLSTILVTGEHISPITSEESMFCAMQVLVGAVLIALVFGNVAVYTDNFYVDMILYQRKMEYLFESMNHLDLPQNLKKRIVMYYDHIWKEYQSLSGDTAGFIPELSKQLSSEVYLYLRTNLILSVPFLRQCSPEVVQRLVVALTTEVYLPNDYIVHKGVPGEEMYLISKGTCEVTLPNLVEKDVASTSSSSTQPKKRRSSVVKVMQEGLERVKGAKTAIATATEVEGRAKAAAVTPVGGVSGANGPRSEAEADVEDSRETKKLEAQGKVPMKRDGANGLLLNAKTYGGERRASIAAKDKEATEIQRRFTLMRAEAEKKEKAEAEAKIAKLRTAKVTPVSGGEVGGRDMTAPAAPQSEITAKPKSLNSFRSIVKTEKVLTTLSDGDYFGEIALVLNTTRTCNVRSKTFVELHVLSKKDFDHVVGKYDNERQLMETIIMEKYRVEAPALASQKRNNAKNADAERRQLISQTSETWQECRLMLDILQSQVQNISKALVSSKVIKPSDMARERFSKTGGGGSGVESGGATVEPPPESTHEPATQPYPERNHRPTGERLYIEQEKRRMALLATAESLVAGENGDDHKMRRLSAIATMDTSPVPMRRVRKGSVKEERMREKTEEEIFEEEERRRLELLAAEEKAKKHEDGTGASGLKAMKRRHTVIDATSPDTMEDQHHQRRMSAIDRLVDPEHSDPKAISKTTAELFEEQERQRLASLAVDYNVSSPSQRRNSAL